MRNLALGSPRRHGRGFPLLVLASLLCLLPACSTPQSRARQKPAIFAALKKSDQEIVLRGEVKNGMSQQAVLIAWGRPDYVVRGISKNEKTEGWTYEHQLTQYAPMRSYEDMYISRIGNAGGYGSYALGSPWFNFAGPYSSRSFHQSNVMVVGYRHRKAVFVNGTLKYHSDWGPSR